MSEPLNASHVNPSQAQTAPKPSPAVADRVRGWLVAHTPELELLGPAGIYLAIVGLLLFYSPGLIVAMTATALLAALGPRLSADTLLRLYRAQPIAQGQGTALRGAIDSLSARAGLARAPSLAIIPTLAIGAFSAGVAPRQVILLTEGLLRRHSLREIVTIAAHEIGHMQAGHLPFFGLADTLTRLAQGLYYAGIIGCIFQALAWLAGEQVLGWALLLVLLAAPTLNSQLQLRLPRTREYDADQIAAALMGDTGAVVLFARSEDEACGSPIDDLLWPVPQRRIPLPSPVRAHFDGTERARALQAAPPPTLLPLLAIADEPLISLVGVGPIEMRPRNRWPGLWF